MRNDSDQGTPIPRAVRDIVIVGLCLSCFPISLRIEWCTWRTDVHQPGKVAPWHQHSGPDSDAWLLVSIYVPRIMDNTTVHNAISIMMKVNAKLYDRYEVKRYWVRVRCKTVWWKTVTLASRSIDLGFIDSSALNHWWTSHCSLSRGFSSWTQLCTQAVNTALHQTSDILRHRA